MSNTPEEILKHYETYVSHKGNPIFLKDNVIKAMTEYASIVSNEKGKEIAELRMLIEKASWLVGNPGCNISSSTDLACDGWQKEWEQYKSSNNL